MSRIPSRYLPTVYTSIRAFEGIAETLRPGQWVKFEDNTRGQYLGKTDAGVFIIRWQREKVWTGNPEQNHNTRVLRIYAKNHGSK